MVVVVVVVVNSMVVSAATVVVVLVVVVDSLGSEVSACEMDELKLTTNAAESRPPINRVVDFFIALTTRTAGNFPSPFADKPYSHELDHHKKCQRFNPSHVASGVRRVVL